MPYHHMTAMRSEAVAFLNCRPGKIYVDGTLGGSGHAALICEKIMPDGLFIGIDQDQAAIKNANSVLKSYQTIIRLFHGNFTNLPDYLEQLEIAKVDGILLDLGLSQHQLEASGRGFSFLKDEPLDMRMDMRTTVTAKDLVNSLGQKKLADLFFNFGEERRSRAIAGQIIIARKKAPIESSLQLAEIVKKAIPVNSYARQKIHPATRVFMALRIAVNKELEKLEQFLDLAIDLLNPKGRLCVLAFHSLEDRIIKQKFVLWQTECICPKSFPQCICNHQKTAKLITKKVVRPSKSEVQNNPMARSTRLRAIEKL